MKIIIFFIFLSPISFASIDDVKSMLQITPGVWEILCVDDTNEKILTEKILNNDLCNKKEKHSKCVLKVKEKLPNNQTDDRDEIREIINACSFGTEYTYKCIHHSK